MVEVVMYISEKLVKFLEDNKILVKRLNFKQIYENISKDLDNVDINDIGVMTYIFYKSGLDPLKYLDNIPSYFLYNVDATDLNISDFKIPTNINFSKEPSELFDFDVFVFILINVASMLYTNNEISYQMFDLVSKFNRECNIPRINKQYLFENFIIKLKQVTENI